MEGVTEEANPPSNLTMLSINKYNYIFNPITDSGGLHKLSVSEKGRGGDLIIHELYSQPTTNCLGFHFLVCIDIAHL